MKKLLLLAIVAFLGTSAFAQSSFNVKAGLNLGNWIGDDVPDNNKVKPGFKVGVGYEYQFNDLISLQPSLMFSTKGTKYTNSVTLPTLGSIDSKVTVNQMYLELPIFVGFRFNVGGNTNLVLSVGPYLAYGVGGKTKAKVSTDIDIPSEDLNTIEGSHDTFGDDFIEQRFDAGIGAAVAVEFGRFFVGVDTGFGLVNLDPDVKAKNISVGVGVGYRF